MTRAVRFTRADYMKLPESYPAELVHGELLREPSPRPWHQQVVGRIYQRLLRLVPGDRIVFSPIDVFIDDHNVLQPDVLVLGEGRGVKPSDREVALPVLVVEVLSPGTKRRDRRVKTRIYLEAGVEEVWLVDPDERTVEVRTRHETWTAGARGEVASRALPGFSLAPARLLETS